MIEQTSLSIHYLYKIKKFRFWIVIFIMMIKLFVLRMFKIMTLQFLKLYESEEWLKSKHNLEHNIHYFEIFYIFLNTKFYLNSYKKKITKWPFYYKCFVRFLLFYWCYFSIIMIDFDYLNILNCSMMIKFYNKGYLIFISKDMFLI